MSDLTRRRLNEDFESWAVMHDDIRVGTIGTRAGIPRGEPPWQWHCGFYPGLEPGQHTSGVADTFEEAKAEFQAAWDHLQTVMPTDAYDRYREWLASDDIRQQRIKDGWTPPQWDGWMTCACGVRFNSWDPAQNQEHAPHIYAART